MCRKPVPGSFGKAECALTQSNNLTPSEHEVGHISIYDGGGRVAFGAVGPERARTFLASLFPASISNCEGQEGGECVCVCERHEQSSLSKEITKCEN